MEFACRSDGSARMLPNVTFNFSTTTRAYLQISGTDRANEVWPLSRLSLYVPRREHILVEADRAFMLEVPLSSGLRLLSTLQTAVSGVGEHASTASSPPRVRLFHEHIIHCVQPALPTLRPPATTSSTNCRIEYDIVASQLRYPAGLVMFEYLLGSWSYAAQT